MVARRRNPRGVRQGYPFITTVGALIVRPDDALGVWIGTATGIDAKTHAPLLVARGSRQRVHTARVLFSGQRSDCLDVPTSSCSPVGVLACAQSARSWRAVLAEEGLIQHAVVIFRADQAGGDELPAHGSLQRHVLAVQLETGVAQQIARRCFRIRAKGEPGRLEQSRTRVLAAPAQDLSQAIFSRD